MKTNNDGTQRLSLRNVLRSSTLPLAAAAVISSLGAAPIDSAWTDVLNRAETQSSVSNAPAAQIESLVLKPAIESDASMGHRSHSSHSSHGSHGSHSSHYSGGGGHRSHASHTSHYSGGLPTSPAPAPTPPPVKPAQPTFTAPTPKAQPIDTILLVAGGNDQAKRFVSAAKKTNLDSLLQDEGPWLVFIPRDSAFQRASSSDLEDAEKLRRILRFHVVSGSRALSDLRHGQRLETLGGQRLQVTRQDDKMTISGAVVDQKTIKCRNGTIVWIDKVLIPSSSDLLATLQAAGEYKTLLAAIKSVGLDDVLNLEVPFTIFAPTDAAFRKIPKEQLDDLLRPANHDKLRAILEQHIVQARVFTDVTGPARTLTTINRKSIELSNSGGKPAINGIAISRPDTDATNGVVHGIDSLLMTDP